jgi:CRP-like cAMP-binding protein
MLDRDTLVALMAKTPLFGDITEEERRDVARQMREASFSNGEVIFCRGDPCRDVYMIVDGKVRLSVMTIEGRELAFNLAGPGSVFGEIAALDGQTRTAFATAVSPVKAATLSYTDLNKLITAMPQLASAIIRLLCARVREADQQLEGVALHRIETRLARFLIGLMRQKDPELKARKASIDIGMSQSELALLLGATRPKVNAALAALEDTGAIQRSGSNIQCDAEELKRIAETE